MAFKFCVLSCLCFLYSLILKVDNKWHLTIFYINVILWNTEWYARIIFFSIDPKSWPLYNLKNIVSSLTVQMSYLSYTPWEPENHAMYSSLYVCVFAHAPRWISLKFLIAFHFFLLNEK